MYPVGVVLSKEPFIWFSAYFNIFAAKLNKINLDFGYDKEKGLR